MRTTCHSGTGSLWVGNEQREILFGVQAHQLVRSCVLRVTCSTHAHTHAHTCHKPAAALRPSCVPVLRAQFKGVQHTGLQSTMFVADSCAKLWPNASYAQHMHMHTPYTHARTHTLTHTQMFSVAQTTCASHCHRYHHHSQLLPLSPPLPLQAKRMADGTARTSTEVSARGTSLENMRALLASDTSLSGLLHAHQQQQQPALRVSAAAAPAAQGAAGGEGALGGEAALRARPAGASALQCGAAPPSPQALRVSQQQLQVQQQRALLQQLAEQRALVRALAEQQVRGWLGSAAPERVCWLVACSVL